MAAVSTAASVVAPAAASVPVAPAAGGAGVYWGGGNPRKMTGAPGVKAFNTSSARGGKGAGASSDGGSSSGEESTLGSVSWTAA